MVAHISKAGFQGFEVRHVDVQISASLLCLIGGVQSQGINPLLTRGECNCYK